MRPGLELGRMSAYLRLNVTKESQMARANPVKFVQEVRAEVSKVVWPGRREVLLTSAMVFALAMVAAIFFFFIDWMIRNGLAIILNGF